MTRPSKPSFQWRGAMAAAVALMPLAGASPPAIEGMLIAPDLSEREVAVFGLDGGGLHVRQGAAEDVLGARAWLAFVAAGEAPPTGPRHDGFTSLLVLADGQRSWGNLTSTDRPESLAWELPDGQRRNIPLEAVRGLWFDESLPIVVAQSRDVVLTSTGDLLEGFVASIGPTIEIEVGEGTISLLAMQCRGLALANPPVSPQGPRLSLADGSVVCASSFGPMIGARVTFDAAFPGDESSAADVASTIVLGEIRAIIADGARLVPLVSIPPRLFVPGPGRRWASPPRIDAEVDGGLGRIELSGPMAVEWTLPAGAARFAANVELPEHARLWGECEVRLSGVDAAGAATVIAHASFDAATPRARLVADLGAARSLRVELLDGKAGPIQDRIILERPVIRVD